ncbi:MAG: PTS sugar transporter subunit IIC [Lactobacillus sp.]|jgi:mannose PTS system EIIC component|uniref:PTS sugar transporter subunit IIC n=1 Tax=Bombilactobacillus bombi TaxID=1303590 RepID=A0A417ZK43_9LACO|nr:PTS sugar transporter subunit IIC [Bombilactobacillus bombi]MCO6543641.1 PTS sugar transporter subunit IIC [Lactobacillus sp.]RHW52236.1 PTS sugar transporter subunit IIC [Bombilactobacillus bombi]
MFLRALLLALWGGFCMLDGKAWHFGFQKPLLAGTGAAIICGDIKQGIMIAAALELMWLGTNNVGLYTPPDIIAGSIIGVSIGVLAKGGIATGIAVAMPSAILVQQLNIVAQTINIGLAHEADAVAEKGDLFSKKIGILHWSGGLIMALTRFVPIFIVTLFGVPVVNKILAFIPKNVLNGLNVSSKLVAAVGFAMLLRMLLKKRSWVFLLIGYVFCAYIKVPTLGIAMLGIAIAYFYDMIISSKQNDKAPSTVTANATPSENSNEEDYDL